MKFNCILSPSVQKLFAFVIVCAVVDKMRIIRFNTVPTKMKIDISEHKSNGSNYQFKIELRPGLMDIVNPSDPKYAMPMNGSYLLEDTLFCSSTKSIDILVLVLSSANHFINRQVIRQTWANESLFSNYGTIRTLFLLGRTHDATVETKIKDEFRLFRDLVQGNFVDSYRNLSHKSIMGYNWVRKRCKNVKFVIKTDDDIVLNLFEIVENRVLETSLKSHHVLCQRLHNSAVVRNKKSKFFVEPHQFRKIWIYPPYCNGQFVTMVNDLVPVLYEAAMRTPFFWIDDVYMYGLSMNNIPAIKYKQLKKEEHGTFKNIISLQRLERVKGRRCQTLFFDTTKSTEFVKLWSALFNVYR